MLAALNKLGVKVFVATALVVVVALGGALFLTKRKADAAANQSIHRALVATRSNIEAKLDSRYNELTAALRIISKQSPYVGSVQSSLQSHQRGNLLNRATEFQELTGAAWVVITDPDGILQASTRDQTAQGDSLGDGALVGLALEGDVTRGPWIEVDSSSGHPVDRPFQAVAVPMHAGGDAGPIVAILIAALPIDSTFAAELQRQTNSEIVFYLLDRDAHPIPSVTTLPASVDLAPSLAAMAADAKMVNDSTQVELSVAGQAWSGVGGLLLTPAGDTIGGYVGLRNRGTELAAFTALKDSFPTAFIAGLLIALLSSLAIARTVTGPVNRLVQATRDVREGKLSGEIVVGTQDEIGELAEAFRRMVGEL